jgi:hypothetical protein
MSDARQPRSSLRSGERRLQPAPSRCTCWAALSACSKRYIRRPQYNIEIARRSVLNTTWWIGARVCWRGRFRWYGAGSVCVEPPQIKGLAGAAGRSAPREQSLGSMRGRARAAASVRVARESSQTMRNSGHISSGSLRRPVTQPIQGATHSFLIRHTSTWRWFVRWLVRPCQDKPLKLRGSNRRGH